MVEGLSGDRYVGMSPFILRQALAGQQRDVAHAVRESAPGDGASGGEVTSTRQDSMLYMIEPIMTEPVPKVSVERSPACRLPSPIKLRLRRAAFRVALHAP